MYLGDKQVAKISRRFIEELLIVIGVAGLLMVFQSFNRMLYTIGWVLLMASTFGYVIFTLVPPDMKGVELVKNYLKTLIIVTVIVVSFVILSITLIPILIR